MSFLDVLSAATPGIVDYRAAKQGAQQASGEREESRYLKLLQLSRQQQQDALNKRVQDASLSHMGLQDEAIRNPKEDWGDFETIMQDGQPTVVQRSNRGNVKKVGDAVIKPPEPEQPELKQDATGRWVPVNRKTGLGPDNKPVVGRVPSDPADAAAAAERRAVAVERRAAQSQLGATRREMQGVLSKRPKPTQFIADPLTKELDKPGFDEALTNWRADSTSTAGALKDAQDYIASLGVPSGEPSAAPKADAPALPSDPAQQALALDAQQAIAKIMASAVPEPEKLARVQKVNERLKAAVQELRTKAP